MKKIIFIILLPILFSCLNLNINLINFNYSNNKIIIEHIYSSSGKDGIWFTNDDKESSCPIINYYFDNNIISRICYKNNKEKKIEFIDCFIYDYYKKYVKIISYSSKYIPLKYELYIFNDTNRIIKEIDYVKPIKDIPLLTKDEEVCYYIYEYNNNNLIDVIKYYDIGKDNIWETSDDINSGIIKFYYNGENRIEKREIYDLYNNKFEMHQYSIYYYNSLNNIEKEINYISDNILSYSIYEYK